MNKITSIILLLLALNSQAQQIHPYGFNQWLNSKQRNEQLTSKISHGTAKLLDDSYFLIADRTDTFSVIGNVWKAADSSQYLYNLGDSTLKSYNRVVNDPDSGWISYLATYYFYDDAKQDTAELYQFYDNVNLVWVNQTHVTYAYDGSSNLVSSTYQYWDQANSQWVNSTLITNEFDGNSNLLETSYLTWSTQWDSSTKLIYAYDVSNNRTLETDYSWNGSAYDPTYQFSLYYNTANLDTQIIVTSWNLNNSTWKNYQMDTLVYDANKRLISSTVYDWHNSTHAFDYTDAKTEYTYDGTGKLTSRIDYYGDGAVSFFPSDQYAYDYDINNNKTYALIQIYNNTTSQFDNYQQTFYYYTDILSGIHPAVTNVNDLNLYPNPASESVELKLQSASNEKVQVLLIDLTGRVVDTHSYTLNVGENIFSLNLSRFNSGTYFIKVIGNNHQMLSNAKVVKQ